MNPIKIDTIFMSALLLMGTGLWARIAMQGFELALVSTAVEWFLSSIKRERR
ncbi:MAG: hypothetical protein HYY46_00040 [Deltaproteobacteria bacterium]|nr:hypothetical protein [Deltaproteobacteria bacterium]